MLERHMDLTLQIHNAGLWRDVMTLSFLEPAKGFFSPCRFGYDPAYVHANLGAFQTPFDQAVSAHLSVDFETFQLNEAP
jgi:serine/threonine-protein kinase HipA